MFGMETSAPKVRSHLMLGAMSITTIVLVLLLSSPVISFQPDPDPAISRSPPEGYWTISEISDEYPSTVQRNGSYYDFLDSLSLPASRPLYLGPGDIIRFSERTSLNLSAPPLFQGSGEEPVIITSITDSGRWKGLNLMEADPSLTPMIQNTEISRAEIGISSAGSDLIITDSRIHNCSRSGIEWRGPLAEGTGIRIEDCSIDDCGYYGIHLQKIASSNLDGTIITDCVTGIRCFRSTARLNNTVIEDSSSLGLFLFGSSSSMKGCRIGSGKNASTTAQNQLMLVNSTAEVDGSAINDGNVCISVLDSSRLNMSDTSVTGGFTDCIQSSESNLDIDDCRISGAGESALHLESSDMQMKDTDIISNGRGSGGLRFSSFFMNSSKGIIQGGEVFDSAYAHFHLVGSTIECQNSDLGEFGEYPVVLDNGANAEYVNIQAPDDPNFKDILSRITSSMEIEVTVLDYRNRTPVDSAQVDINNREGDKVASMQTGPGGRTDPVKVKLYHNTTSGTFSELPLTLIAMNSTSEISTHTMYSGKKHVEMELFPPNEPPTIDLISPQNDTEVEDRLTAEGFITDDLGVYRLRYRLDRGQYTTVDVEVEENGSGYFSVDLELPSTGKGEKEIWIHAFDGTHMSSPVIRRIMVSGEGPMDSDDDGIPDIQEDSNGNGQVDENETDPNDPDSDNDGLLDGIEIDDSDGHTTDPLDEDTDGDFLLDGMEDSNKNGRVDSNETDPNDWDSDGDGVSDLDDRYPLDETRWDDPDDGNEGSLTTLILVVVIGILLVLLAFALYQRLGGNPPPGREGDNPPQERRTGRRSR